MGPSNDHELEIARVVDRVSLDEPLTPDVVSEVLAMLDFRISGSDKEFLAITFSGGWITRLRSKPGSKA